MNLGKDYQGIRMQVWLEAWTRNAQSSSCVALHTPSLYADQCFEDFEKKSHDQNTNPKQ